MFRLSTPFDDIVKRLRTFSVSYDRIDPVGCGELRSLKFRAHAAGASSGAGAPCQRVDALVDGIDLLDQLCVRVETRIAVIEAVDIG